MLSPSPLSRSLSPMSCSDDRSRSHPLSLYAAQPPVVFRYAPLRASHSSYTRPTTIAYSETMTLIRLAPYRHSLSATRRRTRPARAPFADSLYKKLIFRRDERATSAGQSITLFPDCDFGSAARGPTLGPSRFSNLYRRPCSIGAAIERLMMTLAACTRQTDKRAGFTATS